MNRGLGLFSRAASRRWCARAARTLAASFAFALLLSAFAAFSIFTAFTARAAARTAKIPQAAQPSQNSESGSAKLDSLQVTGSARFRSEQIADATGLKPGTTISRADIQAGADTLLHLGPFASVQYRYASGPLGVKLEYQVTDAPALPVAFDDFPWATDDELKAAVKSSVPLFDGTAPDHGAILDQMAHAIERFLAVRGVLLDVTHTTGLSTSGDRQVQEFSVKDEKIVPKVASIDFGDPLATNDRGVKERVADLVGEPFSRSRIEVFEFEQVRPIYLAHAFLRVRFGAPSAKVPADHPLVDRVSVTLPIEPGAPYVWSGATWTGNAAIVSPTLDSALNLTARLKAGDPADGMKIEAAWQAVRDLYGRSGYLDALVDPVPHFDDGAKRVSYSVTVTEGPQYRMGELVLTGLSKDAERRIHSAWKIQPDAIFDRTVYDAFLSDGVQQAFMGTPIHYEKIGRFLQEDPQTGKVNVMLDFQ